MWCYSRFRGGRTLEADMLWKRSLRFGVVLEHLERVMDDDGASTLDLEMEDVSG